MATIAEAGSLLKRQVHDHPELLWEHWSPREAMEACRSCGQRWRERFWTPVETLLTFLVQVLHAGSSCREAVALTLAGRAVCGESAGPSPDPSAYCQARKRLPLEAIQEGVRQVGQRLRARVSDTITWLGRRVWLVDGTSCSMPDTPELQAAFGQPDAQARGCGFPVAKIVALFCWASGAVWETAIGPWWASELPLWRSLWRALSPGELVLADRLYCSFADLVGVMRQGCDAVFRLHQSRPADFRQGRCLGPHDRRVTWKRPTWSARPRGMTREEWSLLPSTLTVRLIRFATGIRGFRSRTITVATTLLDPASCPAVEIARLYRDRWLIELRFRDIKTTLAMDVLRGKTPDVVHKEIHMHLLAYNLIRCLMWQAAREHGRDLHRLSFAGTVDRLNAILPYWWMARSVEEHRQLHRILLAWLARDLLPHRPDRIEPRAVKRRPKGYPRLNRPRTEMKKILLQK